MKSRTNGRRQQVQSVLLFSYGSNNPTQLTERIGSPLSMQAAYAPGYKRVFRGWSRRWGGGVASLAPSKSRPAYGYVAEVTPEQLAKMDQYEGIASGHYYRKEIPVVTADGKSLKAIAYFSTSNEYNPPSVAYLAAVRKTISTFWQMTDDITVE